MSPLEGPAIWLVEDDVSTQRIVAHHLRHHGFQPVTFDTAEKAFAALQSDVLPALIILDMLLPGMSGVDFIRLVKGNPTWCDIPVVVVTVLTRQDAPVAESDDSQLASWVNKPFDTNRLIQTVQGILASVTKG